MASEVVEKDGVEKLMDRLRAISHDTRYSPRSNPRLWIPTADDEDSTRGVWILKSLDKQGRCHMDSLEAWIAWFACPQIGIVPVNINSWTRSPMRLPDFLLHGIDDSKALVELLSSKEETISLQNTPLQQLVNVAWSDKAASSWAKNAFLNSITNAKAGNHPPSPPLSGNGDTPQLCLERVVLKPSQILLYDCWHILSYRPDTECDDECIPEVSYLALSEMDLSDTERKDYVECVASSCTLTSTVQQALKGLSTSTSSYFSFSLDASIRQFHSHGYAVIDNTTWKRPMLCPCRDIPTWLSHVSCNTFIQSIFIQIFCTTKRSSKTGALVTLHLRIDDPDVRLTDSRAGLYLPHQDVDIPLPTTLEDAEAEKQADMRRDYSHYKPVLDYSTWAPDVKKHDPDAILESFSMLSCNDEDVLLTDLANASKRSIRQALTTAAAEVAAARSSSTRRKNTSTKRRSSAIES